MFAFVSGVQLQGESTLILRVQAVRALPMPKLRFGCLGRPSGAGWVRESE